MIDGRNRHGLPRCWWPWVAYRANTPKRRRSGGPPSRGHLGARPTGCCLRQVAG